MRHHYHSFADKDVEHYSEDNQPLYQDLSEPLSLSTNVLHSADKHGLNSPRTADYDDHLQHHDLAKKHANYNMHESYNGHEKQSYSYHYIDSTSSKNLFLSKYMPCWKNKVHSKLAIVCWTILGTVIAFTIMVLLARNSMWYCLGHHASQFQNTVVLISIDGFRPDYLDRGLTPNLNKIASSGVRAKYMQPSFPSVTFSNHYTIATGLYPESHGIVGNIFYDPVRNDTFSYTDPLNNGDGYWWKKGEPIWVTAGRQGKISATCMWPGSEAEIRGYRPNHWVKFSPNITDDQKLSTVMKWIDLPQKKRPLFISLYFQDVDHAGHMFGTHSKEVNNSLIQIDTTMGKFFAMLQDRNIENAINLVIVSDHGMANTFPDQIVYLDDFVDFSTSRVIVDGPIINIYPPPDQLDSISDALAKGARQNGHFQSYVRSQIPSEYNYNATDRIGEIIVVPEIGWMVVPESNNSTSQPVWIPKGMHGYNNSLPDMRALFIGHGSAFKSTLTHRITDPFENIQVYQLLTKIMGLKPAQNNGTTEWLTEFSNRWLK
ncbi:hypothetical protein BDV3_003389 [Batrachochytrium dendrobatidis]|nr:hypothetical protein O5D80_003938 [Batrachochytrium dendrobatidis]